MAVDKHQERGGVLGSGLIEGPERTVAHPSIQTRDEILLRLWLRKPGHFRSWLFFFSRKRDLRGEEFSVNPQERPLVPLCF